MSHCPERLNSAVACSVQACLHLCARTGASFLPFFPLPPSFLARAGMKAVAQVFSSGPPPIPGNMGLTSEFGIVHASDDLTDFHNVSRHQAIWRAQVEEAASIKSVIQAVTSHTGRDYFTTEVSAHPASASAAAPATLAVPRGSRPPSRLPPPPSPFPHRRPTPCSPSA